jgi:hypothetical protein
MTFMDKLMDKLAQEIHVEHFVRDGRRTEVLLTKSATGWKARNDNNGGPGTAISSRQVPDLKRAMSQVERPLRVEIKGRQGTFYQTFKSGKPHSRWDHPCEGLEEIVKGRLRVRPGTAKWALKDGTYAPPALLGVADPERAMENLADQDAKTGVDQIQNDLWKNLLSGADEVTLHLTKESKSTTVSVKTNEGEEIYLGEFLDDETEGLKVAASETDLTLRVNNRIIYEHSSKIYRRGELDLSLMPKGYEALPPEMQDICQNAVRLDLEVIEEKYDPLGEAPGKLSITSYDADGEEAGCVYVDKVFKDVITKAISKTDLLVNKALGIGRSYSQGDEDLTRTEFDARVEDLQKPQAESGYSM